MTDEQFRHVAEDGSTYRVDIGLPDADHDPYDVDLVRSTPDRYGLERDQRLTLAQYPSWGEAEEHQRETEDILAEQGVAGLDDAARQIEQQPYADVDYLIVTYPPDAAYNEEAAVNLVAVGENGATAAQLAVDPQEQVQRLAMDLQETQEIGGAAALLEQAENTAIEQGLLAPEQALFEQRDELPDPQQQADYYFGYGVSDKHLPVLEGVKTWMDGTERRFDTFTIAEYGAYEMAAEDERQLDHVMETDGLEAAMNMAEGMAEAGGYLDPERDDPRVFFEDDAPDDPFTTLREQALQPDTQPYWRFDQQRALDPDGKELGTALVMTVVPDWPADADDMQIEDYPDRAQQLDVGHFNTPQQADRYEQDFRGYLIPGTLDGPELAEVSAQVEGLPDEWREVDAEGLQAFMAGEPRQIDPADWHPHNPNAEREARIAAEGIYHDPIYDLDL